MNFIASKTGDKFLFQLQTAAFCIRVTVTLCRYLELLL